MKKSIFSTVTQKISRRKSGGTENTAGTTDVVTSSQRKIDEAVLPRGKANQLEKNVSSVASSTCSNLPTTMLFNARAEVTNDNAHNKLKQKCKDESQKSIGDDIRNSYSSSSSSEQEVEYDKAALTKLLERKIEQAPAAKVIVSDAMMREALGEINARKSGILTTVKSSIPSEVSSRSNFLTGDGRGHDTITTTATSAALLASSIPSTGKIGTLVNDGGGGDASSRANNQGIIKSSLRIPVNVGSSITNNESILTGDLDSSSGCPLEKVLEFLQAVMTKDYKRALILAKEVEQHEPNNELVSEYMSVLQKIVSKEDEDELAQGSNDTNYSSSEAGEFSEELSSSSETDNISEDEDKDSSESSTESRSSTQTSEEKTKSDENEDSRDEDGDDELEVTESTGNKNGETYTLLKNSEDVKDAESFLHEDDGTMSSATCWGPDEEETEADHGKDDLQENNADDSTRSDANANVEAKKDL